MRPNTLLRIVDQTEKLIEFAADEEFAGNDVSSISALPAAFLFRPQEPGNSDLRLPINGYIRRAPVARVSPISAALIRLFDILSASMLQIIMLPVLILLAVALQIDSPGRLFFVQARVGRYGRMFPCIKFRTMCENADAVLAEHLANCPEAQEEWTRDFKLTNDPRVTRLGAVIRRYSLDEFPQLLNIILGHMSVVGPRPIVRAEIDRYSRYFGSYMSVRPGLTGLWQVSGRNDVSYDQRIAFDCDYVRAKSLKHDLGIVIRTIPAIALAKGAY